MDKLLNQTASRWVPRIVFLSVLLLFFTVPHTLEDFAIGEPANAGVPAALLSFVISVVIGLQAVGLYLLGRGRRLGVFLHIAIGLFWPLASGFAQLPVIFSGEPYRDGFISLVYVFGMIVIGVALLAISIVTLRQSVS